MIALGRAAIGSSESSRVSQCASVRAARAARIRARSYPLTAHES